MQKVAIPIAVGDCRELIAIKKIRKNLSELKAFLNLNTIIKDDGVITTEKENGKASRDGMCLVFQINPEGINDSIDRIVELTSELEEEIEKCNKYIKYEVVKESCH